MRRSAVVGFAQAPGLLYVLGIIPFLGGVIGFFVWIWAAYRDGHRRSTGARLFEHREGRHRLFDRSDHFVACITFLIFLPIFIGRAVMGY